MYLPGRLAGACPGQREGENLRALVRGGAGFLGSPEDEQPIPTAELSRSSTRWLRPGRQHDARQSPRPAQTVLAVRWRARLERSFPRGVHSFPAREAARLNNPIEESLADWLEHVDCVTVHFRRGVIAIFRYQSAVEIGSVRPEDVPAGKPTRQLMGKTPTGGAVNIRVAVSHLRSATDATVADR
jgi:hypothetical protein